MKKVSRIVGVGVLCASIVFVLLSCGGDNPKALAKQMYDLEETAIKDIREVSDLNKKLEIQQRAMGRIEVIQEKLENMSTENQLVFVEEYQRLKKIDEEAQLKERKEQQERIAQEQAAAKAEEERQEQLASARMKIERDAFIRKHISDYDPESFVEIERDKLQAFLDRNEENPPKAIKILGKDIISPPSLDGYIKTYGIEMLDISDADYASYIPDVKLVIKKETGALGSGDGDAPVYNNLEVLVIGGSPTSFLCGDNKWHEMGREIDYKKYPKIRAVYLPSTITKLTMVYSPTVDIFLSPDMKLEQFSITGYVDESFQVPDSIKSLSFYDCPNLKNINISPNSRLTEIRFKETGVTSIYLPETIYSISAPASLKSVTIAAKTPPGGIISGNPPEIPETIEKIYVPAESLKVYEEKWYNYKFTFKNQLTAMPN